MTERQLYEDKKLVTERQIYVRTRKGDIETKVCEDRER